MDGKLNENYKSVRIIKQKLKTRMKDKDDIKLPQIQGYDRRVKGSPFLQVHIEFMENLQRDKDRFKEKWKKEERERKQIETMNAENYRLVKQLENQVRELQDKLKECESNVSCNTKFTKNQLIHINEALESNYRFETGGCEQLIDMEDVKVTDWKDWHPDFTEENYEINDIKDKIKFLKSSSKIKLKIDRLLQKI
jgi:hypothetical protein